MSKKTSYQNTINLLKEYKPELSEEVNLLFKNKVHWWDYVYIADFYLFLIKKGLITSAKKEQINKLEKVIDEDFYLDLKEELEFMIDVTENLATLTKEAPYNVQTIIFSFLKETAKQYNKKGVAIDSPKIANDIHRFIRYCRGENINSLLTNKFNILCWWD